MATPTSRLKGCGESKDLRQELCTQGFEILLGGGNKRIAHLEEDGDAVGITDLPSGSGRG